VKVLKRRSLALELRRLARRERGAQFVELAVVMPVLLMLFMLTAEVGRLFYSYTTLVKATTVGARYLSVADATTAEESNGKNLTVCGNAAACGGDSGFSPVFSTCATAADNNIADLAAGNVTVTRAGTGSSKTVTVAVTGCYYRPLVDLGAMLGDPNFTLKIELSPSTTMRYMQ
jgi:Flp pilus assembly protein TadG